MTKKSMLTAIFAVFLTILSLNSCDKDNSNPIVQEENANSIKSTFSNPQESYGILHNKYLMESECYKESSYKDIVQEMNLYLGEDIVSLGHLESAGYNLEKNEFILTKSAIEGSGMSSESVDYLLNITDFLLNENNSSSLDDIKHFTLKKEIEVINSNFNEFDKKQLLSFLAVFKHSIDFWHSVETKEKTTFNNNTAPRRKFWRWLVAGVVDATTLLVLSPSAGVAVVGAATASAATLVVDKVTIGGSTVVK